MPAPVGQLSQDPDIPARTPTRADSNKLQEFERVGSSRRTLATKAADRRVLGAWSVALIVFYNVSGGPVGSEPIFSAAGPLVGLISVVSFPFIWCLPISLITAELSTAFPDDGGNTVWVFHAFGPFWGFQEGYWSWISGVIYAATYPPLAVAIFENYYGALDTTAEYFVRAAVAIVCTLPNLAGVRLLGNGLYVTVVISLLPFIVLTLFGFAVAKDWSALGQILHANTDSTNTTYFDDSGPVNIQWVSLMTTLFWNYSGFASAGVFAGEVSNPGRTFPKALTIAVLLTVFSYLLPLTACGAYNKPLWQTWQAGSFTTVAQVMGGNAFMWVIIVSQLCSTIGMLIALQFVNAFQLFGMAECSLAPHIFVQRDEKRNVPRNAVLVGLVITLVLLALPFQSIEKMSNALSALAQILILFAVIKLRVTHANVERPFKIPGGMCSVVACTIPPCALLMFTVYTVFSPQDDGSDAPPSWVPGVIMAVVILVGLVAAWLCKFTKENFANLHIEH